MGSMISQISGKCKQKGSILLYGIIALAVVTLAGGAVYSYNSAISRAEKAEAALAECAAKYDQALASIAKQNAAVESWEKAAAEASARAKAAQKAAAKAHVATQSERERLKRLQAEFKPGICPAGQAVQEVRKGLRP